MIQFCSLRNGLSLVEMVFLSKNVSKSFICGIFCGISRLERARGALMQTMAERNGNDTDEARRGVMEEREGEKEKEDDHRSLATRSIVFDKTRTRRDATTVDF